MSKKITLQAWAEQRFDPPPSIHTLRKWARDCWIFPIPEKVGREYRVDPEARYVGSQNGSKAA